MSNTRIYLAKTKKLPGTKYSEVYKKAFRLYSHIKRRTKRRPYIRSAYFRKNKIFLNLFWQHLADKHHRDRTRRLKYYPCAIELIRKSRFHPTSIENIERRSEILHRSTGITSDNEIFYVQIKETKRSGQKYFISAFPDK